MKSLSRHRASSSTALLMRILERPELVSAVRELPGTVLGQWIDRIGLEDAGELVALASTEQLEELLDEDLWKAADAGHDETFRPERFALWLRVIFGRIGVGNSVTPAGAPGSGAAWPAEPVAGGADDPPGWASCPATIVEDRKKVQRATANSVRRRTAPNAHLMAG